MDWLKFKDFFDESWHTKMQPFIESQECDEIFKFLKNEKKRGKRIAPLSLDLWKCFKQTPLTNVRVIMMGMCPYHSEKDGLPVADGLLMGCSITNKMQPTLEQFYKGIEKELYNGMCLYSHKTPDVSYLANQGVLMLNAALTTEINIAGSHIAVWEPFVKYFFEHVIPFDAIPVIFLGKDASKYQKYVNNFSDSFVLSHPASASYRQTDWDTEGVFTKVNQILKEKNNYSIEWLDILPF